MPVCWLCGGCCQATGNVLLYRLLDIEFLFFFNFFSIMKLLVNFSWIADMLRKFRNGACLRVKGLGFRVFIFAHFG